MESFFSPQGLELSKENFISLYSEIYFYKNRNLALEQKMEKLLYCDSLSADDIFEILCWKTGSANADTQSRTIKTQYITIQTTPIGVLLAGKKPQVHEPEVAKALFEKISQFDGIGSVYAITLLHFLSCGEYLRRACGDQYHRSSHRSRHRTAGAHDLAQSACRG